jgi:filamentous hemagglutinin family protein
MFLKPPRLFIFNLNVIPFLIFAVLVLNTLPAVSHAAEPSITADGSLGTNVALDQSNYTISEGTIRGGNQFHSFGQFNVFQGESATFTGPNTINNIIGRVTGGSQSFIDGLLRSEINGANLYLLNPGGVLFGPNASLDVSGSFHVSTADFVRLGNDGILYASLSENSVLTIDPPSAFGFLAASPAGISFQQSMLEVPGGKTLSVVGGDIEIAGGNFNAPGGRVDIASVASPGEVVPNTGGAPDLETGSFENLGTIAISEALIDAGGAGGGTVVIRGGRFLLNQSSVFASVTEAGSAEPGAGIDVNVRENAVLEESTMGTNVFGGANTDSGGVRITADNIEIKNFSQIQSVAFPGSGATSGDIAVTAGNDLVLDNGSLIRTGTGGTGDSGDIIARSRTLVVRDGSVFLSPVFDGSGNGGNIDISAEAIELSNTKFPGYLTGINTSTSDPGTGKAGDVMVNTESLQMFAGTEISSPTFGSGQGGNISVTGDGNLSIQGSESLQPWQTGIFVNTFGSGQGGSLELTANSLDMTSRTSISVGTFWTGDAGNTLINVGNLELKDVSYITTSGLFGAGGNAGNLEVIADRIYISGPESSLDPFAADFTGISTAAGSAGGHGGELRITADSLKLTNRGSISASSLGPDPGGNIEIKAGSLQVLNGSNILASAFGSGNGGNIEVNADSLLISGVHPEPFIDLTGNESLSVSGIASQTGLNGGKAGDVVITANKLELLDGGRLSAETFGPGDGGNMEVNADSVLISGINTNLKDLLIAEGGDPKFASSAILTSSQSFFLGDGATGNSGNVRIRAGDLQLRDGGLISSETDTPGAGGNIELVTDSLTLFNGGSISAVSSGTSDTAGKAGDISIEAHGLLKIDNSSVATAAKQAEGGNIAINAPEVQLTNQSVVSAESSGEGNAGNIDITARNTFWMEDSAVTTEAKQADGGNIKINTEYMVNLWDSEITASVGGGRDTVGGNINIDPKFVTLSNSKIIANAFEGRGGNIQITADVFIADLASVVDASSQLGIDGVVDIRATVKIVAQSVKPLSEKYKSAVALLREPCIARISGGKYSSFTVEGRGALPIAPGGLLPSPLIP